MSLLWVAALLDQGSVTAPGCVLNSHVVETDLAGLRKGVIITLLLLDSTEMSFPAVMTDCHILTHNRYVQLEIILKLMFVRSQMKSYETKIMPKPQGEKDYSGVLICF